MSQEVQREAVRTINSCETLEKTEFEKNLFASYEAHHLENDIVSGLVENLLIVPRIRYFAQGREEGHPRKSDTWRDVTMSTKGEFVLAESESEPFISEIDNYLRFLYWSDAVDNTIEINSFEELFTTDIDSGSFIRVQSDTHDERWFIGQVKYSLIGELNTESMLDSKLVCLESDFSLSDIPNEPNDHLPIEFTSDSDGSFKFRYTDDSLFKVFSHSTGKTIEWLSIIGGSVVFLLGFTSIIAPFMPVSFIEYIIGVIVLVKLYGYVNRDWFESIRKNEFDDMSLVEREEPVTGLGIVEANSMRVAESRKRDVVNGVRERVNQFPKEVTVTPDTGRLAVDDAGVSTYWNMSGSSDGVYSSSTVDFFVELGFEEVDGDEFTGYVVRAESEYADSVNSGLTSVCGNWLLSPKPVEYDSCIGLSDINL